MRQYTLLQNELYKAVHQKLFCFRNHSRFFYFSQYCKIFHFERMILMIVFRLFCIILSFFSTLFC